MSNDDRLPACEELSYIGGASAEPSCPYCGDPARAEIFEAWGHEFMVETCCEGLHEDLLCSLQGDPAEAAGILRGMDAEDLLGGTLRRLSPCDGRLLLDFRLVIGPVEFRAACDFVARHHAHCRAPRGWRYGAACWNGPSLVGVAMVGRPVARMIDGRTTVEVNRLCLDRSMPDPLRHNAASMLYGWAAREARRRGFRKIITYTLEEEEGVSLRAAGWIPETMTRGGSWSRVGRARGDAGPLGRKIRWARVFSGKETKKQLRMAPTEHCNLPLEVDRMRTAKVSEIRNTHQSVNGDFYLTA